MALFGGRLWHGSWYLPDRLLPEGHSGHATSSLDGSRVSTRWSFYYIIRRLVWQSEYLWHCGLQSSFYCQIFGSVQELIPYRYSSCSSSYSFSCCGDAVQKSLRLRRFRLDRGEIWRAELFCKQSQNLYMTSYFQDGGRDVSSIHANFLIRDCLTDGQINKCCTLTLVTLWFLPHDAL